MNTDFLFGQKRGIDSNQEEDDEPDLFDQPLLDDDTPRRKYNTREEDQQEDQDREWGLIMSTQAQQKTAKKVTLALSEDEEDYKEEEKKEEEKINLLSEADQDIQQRPEKKKTRSAKKKSKKKISLEYSSNQSYVISEEEKKQQKKEEKKKVEMKKGGGKKKGGQNKGRKKKEKQESEYEEDQQSNQDWAPNEVIAMAQKTSRMRKRTLMEVAKRLRNKETRKQQLQYSRMYLYFQLLKPYYFINYVFSIQVRMICLSLLPLAFKVKKYKSETPGKHKLQKLIQDFEAIFLPLVNYDQESQVGEIFKWWRKFRFPFVPVPRTTTGKNTRKISKASKSKGPMDDAVDVPEITLLEYQILFGAFLSLIGFQVRVLWKLDIQHLRSKGFIKIAAAAKEKKKQQPKKAQKKAIAKTQITSSEDEELAAPKTPTGRQKKSLNELLSQSEYKSQNLIVSSSDEEFTPEKTVRTRSKSKRQKSAKPPEKRAKETKKKNQQKTPEINEFRPFFQVFDPSQDHWWTLDLPTHQVWEDMKGIKQYFSEFGYLLAVGGLKHNMELPQFPPHPNHFLIYMQDLTLNAVNNPRETVRQRNTFILNYYLQQTIQRFSSWKCVLFCKNPPLKWALLQEQEKLEELQKSVHPRSLAQFRYSPYVLASQINKYQGLMPHTEPVQGLTFKDEPVFLKSQVVELHSADRWKKFGRQVKAGEKPIKKVKSAFNPEKLTLMFGAWQTEKFSIKVTGGKIPVGDYGNFEMFNVKKMPEELEHVVVDRAGLLAKKLHIEYAPCVTGFDIQHGRYVPIKRGVVVFKKDAPALRQAYAEFMEKEDKRAGERSLKEGKKLWNALIRKILVRKYMSSKYDERN